MMMKECTVLFTIYLFVIDLFVCLSSSSVEIGIIVPNTYVRVPWRLLLLTVICVMLVEHRALLITLVRCICSKRLTHRVKGLVEHG
jgi:hypothetical protein